MITFTDENKRLFGEQVADHVDKLNGLMGMSSGSHFEEASLERANLATKLLEGSTRMLGMENWSKALRMFRELLEGASRNGRVWDEKLSQIVSEILETEEHMMAEILTGEPDSISSYDHFVGLQKEIEYLANEEFSVSSAQSVPRVNASEEVKLERNEESGQNGFVTINTIVDSMETMKSNLEKFIISGSVDEELIESTDVSFGRVEFGVEMLGNILKRFRSGKLRFHPTVPIGNVIEAVEDFFNIYSKAEQWDAKLISETDEFNMDDTYAKVLASILEGLIYDIGEMYRGRSDVKFSIYVNVRKSGSYCTVNLRDNAPDFLNDSRFDRPDPVSFYRDLRNVRMLLENACGLLWIEPDIAGGERFKFTIPLTDEETDFMIFSAGSGNFAVKNVVVDSVTPLDSEGVTLTDDRRSVIVRGEKISVFSMDDIIEEHLGADSGDSILVMGLADSRIAIFAKGDAKIAKVRSVQVGSNDNGKVIRSILHMADDEIPVIDIESLINRVEYLRGFEMSLSDTEVEGFSS